LAALSSPTPRRNRPTPSARMRGRSDQAVISQWLLEQSVPARRPAPTQPAKTAARRRPGVSS